MNSWLRLFQEISEEIRREVKPIFGSSKASETIGEGAGGDVTKYIDLLAEKIVVDSLESKHISCTLISEECGIRRIGKGGESYVILDSIDGTTNATRRIPFVSTSIAHAVKDKLCSVDVALVKDLYNDIEFTAIKGEGALHDGKHIHPSTIKSLGKAIIATSLISKKKRQDSIYYISPILNKILKIRHLGSTALEVCYVASGSLEAFIDLMGITRATDIAAAYLILKESGGLTITLTGQELNILLKTNARVPFISTANKEICKEIIDRLNLKKR